MASLTLTTAPTKEPLLIADLRAHLRLDATDEHFLLDQWLTAARRHVESYLGAALLTQTWLLTLDGFPMADHIELPRNPAQSIASIQYVDTTGSLQTMPSTDYDLVAPEDPAGGRHRIVLAYDKHWPGCRAHVGDVRISFVAGHAERKDVPPEILAAILLVAADLHENREAQRSDAYETNPTVRALLAPYRRGWVA